MSKICDICGGSGQISFFQGVSRFLLTVEECPNCAGTGRELEPDAPAEKKRKDKKGNNKTVAKRKGKTKK